MEGAHNSPPFMLPHQSPQWSSTQWAPSKKRSDKLEEFFSMGMDLSAVHRGKQRTNGEYKYEKKEKSSVFKNTEKEWKGMEDGEPTERKQKTREKRGLCEQWRWKLGFIAIERRERKRESSAFTHLHPPQPPPPRSWPPSCESAQGGRLWSRCASGCPHGLRRRGHSPRAFRPGWASGEWPHEHDEWTWQAPDERRWSAGGGLGSPGLSTTERGRGQTGWMEKVTSTQQ